MSLNPIQIENLIQLYLNENYSTHKLAELYKVGHKKISQILKDNNVELKKRGGQIKNGDSLQIEKSKVKKFVSEEKEYVAQCKKNWYEIK